MHMAISLNSETGDMEAQRTLRGSGGSTVLSIPPAIMESAGVSEGDEVTIAIGRGSDTVRLTAAVEE